MKLQLKELLKINYPTTIEKISEEEGGGYCASIPMLSNALFRGDGETREEALDNLDTIKSHIFKRWIDEGINIPIPQNNNIEECSGKFLIRMPRELHFDLQRKARENATTLNQYCVFLLSKSVTIQHVDDSIRRLEKSLSRIEYQGIGMPLSDRSRPQNNEYLPAA